MYHAQCVVPISLAGYPGTPRLIAQNALRAAPCYAYKNYVVPAFCLLINM